MSAHNALAEYRSVQSRGAVIDASPTRLIQLALEQILAQLNIARGCMERMAIASRLHDVQEKGRAIAKTNALVGELAGSLDLQRGGEIAENLLSLYSYVMRRLTLANLSNDVLVIDEVAKLIREIKSGWDQIVTSAA